MDLERRLRSGGGSFGHEQVRVQRGARSGVPVIVAVHSTVLGQAIGGCRLARYPRWDDALTDALRLSTAMTEKCAVAGLPNGGGKTVVALPPDAVLAPAERRALLLDVADVVESLDGAYATGPDVGTDSPDMVTVAERTRHVFCKPTEAGGSGDPARHTAAGVVAALHAVCDAVFGSAGAAGRRFGVIGLGHVGSHVARELAAAGGRLVVTDVDVAKRGLADELGAEWVDAPNALAAEVDVLIPAALGGSLTPRTVPLLRCTAIAGPANNQLDDPATAELLHRRGILWAPDFVVSAGGAIHATAVELHHETTEQAAARVLRIRDTLAGVLRDAAQAGVTPAVAARELAYRRLREARAGTVGSAAP